MKVAIYNRGIAFDGSTLFNQPLGGSETSIVHMAAELAHCGHAVTVYANVSEGGNFRGVQYRHNQQFFRDYPSANWDVLISFRSFDPFLLGRIAPRMIFWSGDASDQPALKHFEHSALQQNIDLIFCVSKWHRQSFINTFKLPEEKVVATRNGFSPELVPETSDRDWTRCAYSSTPFRGLDVLLRMFPLMRQRTPTLRLDVFSSMKVYGWNSESDQEEFGAIYKAAMQAGVTWHGSIAQPQLMQHLSRTGLLLYPNTFAETSCIAAIEAQACGAVVITTARAALAETVEHGKTGICLNGEPASPDYQREFINTVRRLLENPSRLQELSCAARERAFRLYQWPAVASEWTNIFERMPARPVHQRWNGPLSLLQKTHNYLRNGNLSAAGRVLAVLDDTPFLRTEVEALKGRLTTWM
jgi:glycosyltransferase involved in cell wall biosynthesis